MNSASKLGFRIQVCIRQVLQQYKHSLLARLYCQAPKDQPGFGVATIPLVVPT